MKIKNVEIKAKTEYPNKVIDKLKSLNADYRGCDTQIDTYFNIQSGRLKLRQGNIENSLIFYNRENTKDSKLSDIAFSNIENGADVLDVLLSALGEKITVKKDRHIYFIDHVKFHVDYLDKLGTFVEIEVIDEKNEYSESEMHRLCAHYMDLLSIQKTDLLTHSYSDMLGL